MNTPLFQLPPDLPRPIDDGAAAHLAGMSLPNVTLQRTDGTTVSLSALRGRWVMYVYPMTGRPGVPLPDGWDGLQLPTFTASGMEWYKRLTLVVEEGTIRRAFYPVFPPDRNADDVLAYLRSSDR